MTLIVTRTAFTPAVPAVPANLDPLVDIETLDPTATNYYMPTTYNGSTTSGTFSVQVKFGEEGAEQVLDPTYISSSSQTELGLSVTTSPSTFTIQGKAKDEFAGSYYEFAMKDKSLKILPPDTSEDFYALVRYKMPTPTFLETQHTLTIGIPQDPITAAPATTATLTIYQWCLWYYYPVIDNVAALKTPRL